MDGSGWEEAGERIKPLTPDLFHVLPNIKLFSPRSHCTEGPVAASEPKKCFILPAQGLRSNGRGTTKGSAPPPSPAPLKTGKALSCQHLSLDTQMLWGLRNKWNLPTVLMSLHCFLPPGPPQQGEGEERTKDTQINGKKTQLNSKRGRKSTVTHSSKHNWREGQQHQPQAGIALGESPRAEPGAHQGSILDCTWRRPQLCVPLLTQPRGHTTSPLLLPELKLRPTLLHKRHQQQSPAQEPPQGTVWGQRCHYCSPDKPNLAWHPKKKPSPMALTHETPSRCCSPARVREGSSWWDVAFHKNLLPARGGGSGQEQEGKVVCSNRWPLR